MTQFWCFARGNHSSAWRTDGGGHGHGAAPNCNVLEEKWSTTYQKRRIQFSVWFIHKAVSTLTSPWRHLSNFLVTQQQAAFLLEIEKVYIITTTTTRVYFQNASGSRIYFVTEFFHQKFPTEIFLPKDLNLNFPNDYSTQINSNSGLVF